MGVGCDVEGRKWEMNINQIIDDPEDDDDDDD